ncbi:MAG TPA: iron donor protein CyaY [Burkholderiales bacterium]|nr:iron donor protein CyaY [Burkholderiales bacterium]
MTAMTPSEFESLAEAMLERIARAVEESGADCDCAPKAAGVLELEFADGNRIIVNRHSAAQEIWVAAKSGGYHFRFDGSKWVDTRDKRELLAALSEVITGQSGRTVTLR